MTQEPTIDGVPPGRRRPGDVLGARLAAVARSIPRGSRVADIGTDHGRLPLALLVDGRASACVATEREPKRLAGLERSIAERGRPAGLDLRVGPGLEPLEREDRIDTIVLAGLGGGTIARILARDPAGVADHARLVLQPQTRWADVRRALRSGGRRLIDERMVEEGGRDYLVLTAVRGEETAYAARGDLSDADLLEAGPLLLDRRDAAARAHWVRRARRLRAVVARLAPGVGARVRAERSRAERVVRALGGAPPATAL